MITIYFVRHAQPEHAWEEDHTRPLTKEGIEDSKKVLEFFKDKKVDHFYCSPYKRSVDTISETANHFGKEIILDERLRERESLPGSNNHEMFRKRWADFNYHEEGGESLGMVQQRNIAALKDILGYCDKDATIVIGTHGTALSSILHYYNKEYNCDSFLRIIDWMPYIVEIDFEDEKYIGIQEHLYIPKEYGGKLRG